MRIGALSALTGLSRDTIRFYEKHGLIGSAASTSASNSYRDYSEETAERLRMITDARQAGLSVADLKTLLDAMEGRPAPGFDLEDFLDTRIAQLDQVITTATHTRDMLQATRGALAVTEDDYAIAQTGTVDAPTDRENADTTGQKPIK